MIFHILQDVLLIRKGVSSLKHTAMFYGLSISCILLYFVLLKFINIYVAFIVLWLIVGVCVIAFVPKANRFELNLLSRKTRVNV
jgi:hypothetical protein